MIKIMLISSVYTGYGHKAIADALTEQFQKIPDVLLDVVDGFELIGRFGVQSSKLYGVVTRRARGLWRVAFSATQHNNMMNNMIERFGHHGFREHILAFQPDLILSVHPMFNGSIIDFLERENLNIPVVTLQADIVNIHKYWCDPRAKMTICPTEEAYASSLRQGMPPEKLKIIGFPTRAKFCEAARKADTQDYEGSRPIRCLLMSGGEGSGEMQQYAQALLEKTNARLTIVCGRNKRLREALRRKYAVAAYAGRVSVLGFVNDLENRMAESDLMIARGSPNAMFEAVVMNVPVLITGALPGQERDNPALFVKYRLGATCESPEALPGIIDALLRDGAKEYREIRAAQRAYRQLDNAERIAKYVRSLAE